MISRIWHGWTNRDKADAYVHLLRTQVLPGIGKRQISRYRGAHLLRRGVHDGVEFITITWFESLDAVREFAGEDYETSVVPPKAKGLLSRFDDRSQH